MSGNCSQSIVLPLSPVVRQCLPHRGEISPNQPQGTTTLYVLERCPHFEDPLYVSSPETPFPHLQPSVPCTNSENYSLPITKKLSRHQFYSKPSLNTLFTCSQLLWTFTTHVSNFVAYYFMNTTYIKHANGNHHMPLVKLHFRMFTLQKSTGFHWPPICSSPLCNTVFLIQFIKTNLTIHCFYR